jgi:cation:H+ antiporter
MPDTLYINLPLFLLGLFIIIKGSDLFLDSAVWMARASGISQVVIGATVVSFCTTLPEMVASTTASFKGASDMALGNAVGSVICNTGLILGIVLLLTVARIRREIFLIKGAFMLGALLIGLILIFPSGQEQQFLLSRQDGLVLLVFLAIFVVVNYYESLHTMDAPATTAAETVVVTRAALLKNLSLFAGGALTVVAGAWLLIEFGQRLARNVGMNEAVISLLFIALGTSLPELFTAISAIRKKAQNISVGNIFGANVLNLAFVVGTSSVIRPISPKDRWLASFDIPFALVICSIAFGIGWMRGRVGRKTGLALLGCYVAYLISIVAMKRLGA